MKVHKRTFLAKTFPQGSEMRNTLNCDWLTSEYMPSQRYGIRHDDGTSTPYTCRTKAEAEIKSLELKNRN